MARHCHKLKCPKYKAYPVISLHKPSHGSQLPWSWSSFAVLRNAGCALSITPQSFHLLPICQLHQMIPCPTLSLFLALSSYRCLHFLAPSILPFLSFLQHSLRCWTSSRSPFLTTSLQSRELPGWLSGLGTPWPASILNFDLSQHLWASHRSSLWIPSLF